MIELKLEQVYHLYCRRCHARWAMSRWPHTQPDEIKHIKCPDCKHTQEVINLSDE